MKFNVTILQPPGYAGSLVLLEAAENVLHVLRRAGYEAHFRKNRVLPGAINIVFGAHLQMPEPVVFPDSTVIFNTEQLDSGSVFVTDAYRALLDRFYVWDYSETNLCALSHRRRSLFPFTYVPALDRVTPKEKRSCDLVFYGTMNPHRDAIVRALRARGVRVSVVRGLFAQDRDRIMRQARAVLNLHYYDTQILQQIRCFYPLTNGIPVISENYPGGSAPGFYRDSLLTPGDRDLVDYTVELLADAARFDHAARQSLAAFRASQGDAALGQAVEKTLADLGARPGAGRPSYPDRINLGAGKAYRPGWLNIDAREATRPDLLLDLGQPQDFPIRARSELSGEVVLEKGSIACIEANTLPSQVPDLPALMRTCLELLREGAEVSACVPHDLGLLRSQQPGTLRGFNQTSWLAYTERAWELGWTDSRFELIHTEYQLSALGQRMQEQGVATEAILDTPRAVEAMRVTLRKTPMPPAERTLALVDAADWLDAVDGVRPQS